MAERLPIIVFNAFEATACSIRFGRTAEKLPTKTLEDSLDVQFFS